jgi:hypothetical protein
MKRIIEIIVIAFLTASFTFAQRAHYQSKPAVNQALPPYLEKLEQIPDLTQTDPNGGLPGGGIFYCAPVAVSNSMMWFADIGFDKLKPNIADRKKAQFEIARRLGSEQCMDTSLKTGSDADGVIIGVSRYLINAGYKSFNLEYQGWCRHPRYFSTRIEMPQIEWIKKGLLGDSAVWLNAGWYKYLPDGNRYYRFGEHWLTLAGYGVDRQGKVDDNILIVHDPAPRAGTESKHTYIKLRPITSGQLVGKAEGLPRSAVGYYMLAGDMELHNRADYAILDGAVVLKMRRPLEQKPDIRTGRGQQRYR